MILITGLMMLSLGSFYGITSPPQIINSNQIETNELPEETLPLVPHEDWTAPEEQFELGLAGKKPGDFDETNNGPRSAHFSSAPMPANLRVLVILVKYSDLANTTTRAAMNAKVFGATNSLKAYFSEISYGTVTMTGDTTDWLTLPYTRAYYGRDTSSSDHDTYYGPRSKYHTDSLDVADPYVDFANYDRIIIIHAGDDQASSAQDYDMWSHAYFPYYGPYWYRDGVGILTTSCLAELEGFGTICHEFGHQNNLPDLYDYNGINNYMDHWCLMDAGSWNSGGNSPAHMTGYCKNYAGFIPANKIRTINSGNILTLTLDDLETGGSNYLLAKIPLADADHYYLVEARFQTGFDTYLPNKGVLVTKVDNTIDSGYGIVDLMDSHPSTAIKDDGEHDVDSTAGDVSAFDDDVNNIHIIIVSSTSSTYTIMIIRSASWTWNNENLLANNDRSWSWTGLSVGQQMVWDWIDVPGGSDNLNSWVEHVGGSNYESVSNYQHDAGVYRITTAGDYKFHLANPHLTLSTDYSRTLLMWTAPSLIYTSVYTTPSTVYLNGLVQLSVTIRNNGGSTAEGISLTLTLPSQIGLDTGEVLTHTVHELGYWESYTTVWYLKAVGTGSGNIHVACSSTYGGSPTYDLGTTVQVDSIAPTVNWYSPNFDSTNSKMISISWTGSDAQSGLKNFEIYMNGTLNGTVSGTEDSFDVDNLTSAYWNITVRAIDYGDNIKEVGRMFLVDLTKPTIEKFNPSILWVRSYGSCSFTARGYDAGSGLEMASLYYRTSGPSWSFLDDMYISSGDFVIEVTLGSLSVASVEFKLNITDVVGNENESSIVVLFVDNGNPSLSGLAFTSDSKNAGEYSGLIHIRIASSDALSGISTIRIHFTTRETGEHSQLMQLNSGTGYYEYTFDSSEIEGTEYVTFDILATDLAGNTMTDAQTIKIANANPMFGLIIGIVIGAAAGGSVAIVVILKKKGKLGSSRGIRSETSVFKPTKAHAPAPELERIEPIQPLEIAPSKIAPTGSITKIPVQESQRAPPPVKQPLNEAMQRFESGKNYISLKQLASAENAFREAVRMDPSFGKAWYQLGLVIRTNPARYDEAEEAFRTAIKFEFANPLIWANLGFLLKDMGRAQESKASLERALALAPKGWAIEEGVRETLAQLDQTLAPAPSPQPPVVNTAAITPTVQTLPKVETFETSSIPAPAPSPAITEKSTPAPTTKVCPKCAQVIPIGSKFCNKCGQKV